MSVMQPLMLGKIIHVVASNREHISVNRSRLSIRCGDDHKQRVLVHRYITCKIEEFLSLNTLSFLYSHSNQITAIALTLICFLNLFLTSLSHFLKMLVTVLGKYKVKAS
jgi:hypothetical protein